MPNNGKHLIGHGNFNKTVYNPAKKDRGWVSSLKKGDRVGLTYITDMILPNSVMYCRDYVYDTVRKVTYHSNGQARVRLLDTNYLADETGQIIEPVGVTGKICHPDLVKVYVKDKEKMFNRIKELRFAPYDKMRWAVNQLEL